jgi:hypothetical protein
MPLGTRIAEDGHPASVVTSPIPPMRNAKRDSKIA